MSKQLREELIAILDRYELCIKALKRCKEQRDKALRGTLDQKNSSHLILLAEKELDKILGAGDE